MNWCQKALSASESSSNRHLERGHGLCDGDVSVQAEADESGGGEVEGEGADEHERLAGRVPGHPLHGDAPPDLQRHHHEGDHEVGDGQVHNHDVHVVAATVLHKKKTTKCNEAC